MVDDRKTRAQTMPNTELHSEHLCYITAQGLHLTEAYEYRVLVENPKFRCRHCGRTAGSRRNLCVPGDL